MISVLAKAMVEPLDEARSMRVAEGESETRKARAKGLASWTLAWLPAITALAWVCCYRMPVPFHDDWAFVMEYQRMVTTGFSWEELFRLRPGDHRGTHVGHAPPGARGRDFAGAAI